MAELPKIVQEWNNYRLWSQLFSSQSAAQAGLNRLMSQQKTPTTSTNPVLPTQTITPPVAPTQSAPVAPTTTVLPISKESEVYKQLTAKGYDDAKILDLYNQAKAKKTPEEQARITKQEPVKPSTAIDPIAEQATPAVNVNVNNEPAKPVEPPKTDKWPLTPLALSEYQDNSTVRQNEIVNNLNGYRQSNPEFLTNIDTFRKTFSYGLRSNDQKQLLDNWYLGYQKWVKLGNMGTNAIVDQYWSGNITSSDLEQLRLNNPSKYQEVMDAINKKDIVRTYQNELYETDEQKTIMAQLDEADWQWSIFEEYKKVINGDEVKALQTEIQDMETQREQLSLELNDIKDQVEKRYEWTGATKWKIAYIVAKESAALQKQITSLWIDSANRVDKYNSIVNTAKETMQLQLQEQEAERAARNQKMSELGFYYEYDPVGMAERAENIFNIENPDINSPDAKTARRALNNELTKYYEKYGDIIIRPQSQALNDIIAQAKTDWTSLSAALKKNFTDQLQSKSLYGQTLGKNLGIDMWSYSMSQLPDGNWTVNAKAQVWAWSVAWIPWSSVAPSGNLTNVTSASGKTIQIDSVASPSLQSAFDEIWSWLVVWQWHRDQVATIKTMASKFWIPFNEANPAETAKALSAAGHQVAVPWGSKHETGMAVDLYDANGNAPSADQVAILNAKWRYQTAGAGDMWHFEYVWAKYTGANKQILSDIKLLEAGMINKSDIQWIQDVAYAAWLWDEFDKAMNKWANVYMTDTQRDQMNKSRDKFRADPVVKWFEESMTQFDDLAYSLTRESWPWDMAAIFQFMKTMDPTSVVRESEFENAANSAGLASKWKNMYKKLEKWDLLTPQMTEEFKLLTKKYIENKAKSYNRLYNDMVRDLEWFNIDKTFYPTNAAQQLNDIIEWLTTTTTTPTITNPFTQWFTIPEIWWVVASFYGG